MLAVQVRDGEAAEQRVDETAVDRARDEVRRADELGGPAVGGLEVELLGRAGLHDRAVAHQRDPVGERERLLAVVRDEEHRHVDPAQDVGRARRASRRGAAGRCSTTARRAARPTGRGASARASATRCCWPPESSCGKRCAYCVRPTRRSSSGTRSRRSPRRTPKPTFCSTLRCGKSAYSWKTIPIPRACAGTKTPGPKTGRSSIAISPASGRSKPATSRSSVVLPQPLGPSSATNSPRSTQSSLLEHGRDVAEALRHAVRADGSAGHFPDCKAHLTRRGPDYARQREPLRLGLPARQRQGAGLADLHLRGARRGREGRGRRGALRPLEGARRRRRRRRRRAGGDQVARDRAGGRGAAAGARRPRALARRVLRLDPGAHARARRAARAEASRRAAGAAVARRARGRGRAGAADRRAARGDRPDRRRVRERRELPARRRDRQRQDRGLPPGVRGGARARARRDRARAGDRADAAGGRPLRGALRRRARDPALGPDRRRAPRRARADRARRGAHRRRRAVGDLRAGARPRADLRRRGARPVVQAGLRPALRRAHGRGEARRARGRRRGLRQRDAAAGELGAARAARPRRAARRLAPAGARRRPAARGRLPALRAAARRRSAASPRRAARRSCCSTGAASRRRSTAARAGRRCAARTATSRSSCTATTCCTATTAGTRFRRRRRARPARRPSSRASAPARRSSSRSSPRRCPELERIRLDADVVAERGAVPEALRRFAETDRAVLLGTQMVAKGHHFAGVSLAAVVDADTQLGLPDFRAEERTFALLDAARGSLRPRRAGARDRADLPAGRARGRVRGAARRRGVPRRASSSAGASSATRPSATSSASSSPAPTPSSRSPRSGSWPRGSRRASCSGPRRSFACAAATAPS